MQFHCTQVSATTAGYTDTDGQSTPSRAFEVHLAAVTSEHGPGTILEIKLLVLRKTQYQQGKLYDLPLEHCG